jgi:hypothetical protein
VAQTISSCNVDVVADTRVVVVVVVVVVVLVVMLLEWYRSATEAGKRARQVSKMRSVKTAPCMP